MKKKWYIIIIGLIVNSAIYAQQPNILWITSEDNGPFLGCYGDSNANTPNLDKLAENGIRYTNCFSNTPVCAVARSSIITGAPAPTSGMHHMRSKIKLPNNFVPYPTLLKKAGYYVTNNLKTDYNTRSFNKGIWDECGQTASYTNRKIGQPFFAVFNINLSHESRIFDNYNKKSTRTNRNTLPKTPSDNIKIPPYQTSTPENILDWQRMYDKINEMDRVVGDILDALKKQGEAENTIVIYCSDHGGITLRSKRYLYDSGTRVPLIVSFPPKWQHLAPEKPSSVSKRLVQFLDMPRTFLSLANIDAPEVMNGYVFLGEEIEPQPETIFLFSNRFDEAPDTRRGVTDGRWKYIRNYEPDRLQHQLLSFPFGQAGQRAQWLEFKAGTTNKLQSAYYLPQAPEELFDTESDPDEIHNLIDDPKATAQLFKLRNQLDNHILDAHDLGFLPEPLSASVDLDPNQTIYSYGQSTTNYPLPEIMALAALASEKKVSSIPKLKKAMSDPNPNIRYWAIVGLRVLGKEALSAKKSIEGALDDSEASVRITAAVTWGKLGFPKKAAKFLLNEAKIAKTDAHALWALDGIKYLNQEEIVKTIPTEEIVKGNYSKRTYDFLKAGGNIHHIPIKNE